MTAPEFDDRRLITLTPMQRAVLGELAHDGPSNATIGHRLGVSEDTVKTHMKAVFGAIGVDTRAAVVAELLHKRIAIRTSEYTRNQLGQFGHNEDAP